MSALPVVIVGAGGQARELAWYIDEINRVAPTFDLRGFVVSDMQRLGPRDNSVGVLGDFGWIREHTRELGGLVLGLGTPSIRLRLAGELCEEFPDLAWPIIAHPSAVIDWASAKIGRGVMVGAGVVATVNVAIGDFALLNFGCTIGHEARVGRGCVVNPSASVSGGVTLGDGVLVGAGAVVLQYLDVGTGATVGAGAVVTSNVPADGCVVGIPARPLVRR